MKFSKQALLGTTVLLGGSVLLYATMHQVLNAPAKPAVNSQQVIAKPTTDKQSEWRERRGRIKNKCSGVDTSKRT